MPCGIKLGGIQHHQILFSDLGYTDQAHFIHDFKLFTGYKPQQNTQKL